MWKVLEGRALSRRGSAAWRVRTQGPRSQTLGVGTAAVGGSETPGVTLRAGPGRRCPLLPEPQGRRPASSAASSTVDPGSLGCPCCSFLSRHTSALVTLRCRPLTRLHPTLTRSLARTPHSGGGAVTEVQGPHPARCRQVTAAAAGREPGARGSAPHTRRALRGASRTRAPYQAPAPSRPRTGRARWGPRAARPPPRCWPRS